MISASACLGMYLSLESILDPGDEVIIHAPYFTPYSQQIELAGAVFNDATLRGVCKLAIENDIVIIADEIYGAYVFSDPFISLSKYPQVRDRLIILNSFSKDYTMTGWRVGNIIAPKEIIQTCQLVNENVVFTAPSISQRAAIYALRHRKEIQPPAINLYKERVMTAYECIGKIPWMKVLKPKGTFYLFINIEKTGLSCEKVSELILDKAQVLTIPGTAFGKCGKNHIRIACTVDKNTIEEAFERIGKIKFD